MLKRNKLPIGTIFMILIIALALLGVGYSLWSETLFIEGTVHTGEVDIEFSIHDDYECVDVWGVGDCLPEPPEKEYAANCVVEYSGPDGDSNADDGPDQLSVTIDGMYPSWHCMVEFDVTNIGNVPVHVKLPVPTSDIPEWVATNFEECYEDSIQLHEGESTGICAMDIHFNNDQAPPELSGPYTFSWEILAVQWNEDPPAGPEVFEGYDPAFVKAAGIRFRSFGNTGGDEIYLGIPDLGVAANRAPAQFTWSKPGTHAAMFSYDPGTDTIYGDVNGTSLSWSNVAATANCPPADWNALQFDVVGRDPGVTVQFNNFMIDGNPIGDFDSAGAWKTWTVINYDFSPGFVITGDIVLDGTFGTSQENSKIELGVGCMP